MNLLIIILKGGINMADNKEEQKKKKGSTKGDPVVTISE
jgi:hypothetical protein